MWVYILGIIVFIMIKICIAIKEWLTVVSLQPTVSIIFLYHQHLSKYCKHSNIACTISDKKGFLNKLTWILFSAFLNVCIIYSHLAVYLPNKIHSQTPSKVNMLYKTSNQTRTCLINCDLTFKTRAWWSTIFRLN